MPITIKDSDDGIGSILTSWGIVKENDIFDAIKKDRELNKFSPNKHKYHISDHTTAEEIEFTSRGVKLLTEVCKAAAQVNPKLIAAVVAENDFIYGLSRMWQLLSDETDWEIKVFRNRKDAENWVRQRVKEKHGIDGLTFQHT
jgi:hypothetical protein